MATSVPGYQINEIVYKSPNSLIYRGLRKTDDLPVILKILNQAYPSPEKIAWFKREYESTGNLNPAEEPGRALTGVSRAYGLKATQNRWIMILGSCGDRL